MIRASLLIFLLGVVGQVLGQQTHQYTQYIFNQFGHNPAVAGSAPCVDVRLGGRKQWVGFEGSPLDLYGSVHGRIRQRKKAVVKGYHALGLYIQREDQGPVGRTVLYPAYAYHIRISPFLHLGMGVFAGIQQYRFDRSRIAVPDQTDPAIPPSSSVMIIPDLSAGLWLYSKKTYLGLGVLQAWKKKIPGIGAEASITPHFNLTGGYLLAGKGDFGFVPSFMLKYTALSMPALDLNFMFDYQRNLALGLSYRVLDAVAGIVRVRFGKFSVGYSFDLTTTKMRWGSWQGHEITLGINACRGRSRNEGLICPAYR